MQLALLLQKIILMTTAYDRKLVQNLCYLLSSSVVDMAVGHNPLAVVPPPLFQMKGCFHCHQNFHILLDPCLVTASNETELINLHSTHIIWLLCAVLSTWQICTTNQYQVSLYYTNVLSTRLLLPLLPCNFNNSL